MCYLYKYAAEKKTNQDYPWVIRQTGVYHQFCTSRQQSVFMIMSPMPQSSAELQIRECMKTQTGQQMFADNPMSWHALTISSALSNWVGYCSYYESSLEHIGSLTLH